jgi:hypothetical protein
MAATMKRDPHEKPHGNPHGPRKLENVLPPDINQLSAVVNSTTDKPPAQGVHGSNHEGFMTLEPTVPVWLALPRRQGDRDVQNPWSWGSWLSP